MIEMMTKRKNKKEHRHFHFHEKLIILKKLKSATTYFGEESNKKYNNLMDLNNTLLLKRNKTEDVTQKNIESINNKVYLKQTRFSSCSDIVDVESFKRVPRSIPITPK